MCGIVGYYGPSDPKDVLLSGLKTLEYRGYDSAGVAILHNNEFKRVRAEGKLSGLEDKLKNERFDGHLGIGHTRWATHGAPTERNAHPHVVGNISLVHNGIIENYLELRDSLGKETIFESETDSELVAHLVSREVQSGKKLLEAVLSVQPKLSGAYSILVVSKDQPDEIVAFKNGPPLIVGLTKDAALVASDVQALIAHTKEVIYLEDFEVAHIQKSDVSFYDNQGNSIKKEVTTVDWTAEQAEKQGYPHFMLKEIFEQPQAVANAVAPHVNPADHTVELKDCGFDTAFFKSIEKIYIIACGTSYYAGMTGKYLIEHFSRVPVDVDIASEFRYREPVLPKNSMAIFISQSGETADTLAALRMMKSSNVPCLSICNVKQSTIDREADGQLYMNSGVEIGVASTKAFASSLSLMNLLALQMGKAKGLLDIEKENKCVKALLSAPSHMENVLTCNKFFAEAAEVLKRYKGYLYLGRGISYPIALEGALKLKELAYKHAEGYAAGEMKHGPLALIDKDMAVVVLAPKDKHYEKTVSNLEEAKARGGQIIAIGTEQDEKLKELSIHYLSLPKAAWGIYPLLEVLPLQLLSYHVAAALGNDVDQPRNLAKSVTVE